ncbi:WhiB family transcriptional regulator, redox-sensing transcriptional regulator [Actinopolymorpha cephalotaxi]|uniref:Transcriptional regulator WhiB n=1 Tax=Actinopolymorpha cephalotaxi TaxID=504797 RepID=A0A1I2N983_9ACTN|nr:WhiB family transcriptional regulator [Actinopolymorpha cephalotaxi]NYH85657.1 WhiB family redox-sensing transcriptional regulator [Actinopolymorpha cephalotaxi]SFF99439.1 WhiB family transcriptional regulator, redox-sensing transcriptional regulator [Actinopolymorpha cephalotaxi]
MPERRAAQPGGRNRPVPDGTWEWHQSAACAGEPSDLFYGPEGEKLPARRAREARALSFCATCPVSEECRDHALGLPEAYGVWGGTTEGSRLAVRRGRRPVTEPVARPAARVVPAGRSATSGATPVRSTRSVPA